MLQSVALTAFGGLLAIIGTLSGYYLQAREARRTRSETYAREDRFRLHRDRRESYTAFHLVFGQARSAMITYKKSRNDTDLLKKVREVRADVWAAYVPLWHVATEDVIAIATKLMREIEAVGWHGGEFDPDRWGKMVEAYVSAVRFDLTGQPAFRRRPEASGLLPPTVNSLPSPGLAKPS